MSNEHQAIFSVLEVLVAMRNAVARYLSIEQPLTENARLSPGITVRDAIVLKDISYVLSAGLRDV